MTEEKLRKKIFASARTKHVHQFVALVTEDHVFYHLSYFVLENTVVTNLGSYYTQFTTLY